MKPEGSSPYLQQSAPSTYPELDQSISRCPSYCLKIHFSIILPSMPRSLKWSLSLRFPHQNPVCASPLRCTCHMPRPSHPSRFHHLMTFGQQYESLLILPLSCHIVPFRSKYAPQHPILNTLNLCSSRNVRNQVSHPHKITILYISIFIFVDRKLKEQMIVLSYKELPYVKHSLGPSGGPLAGMFQFSRRHVALRRFGSHLHTCFKPTDKQILTFITSVFVFRDHCKPYYGVVSCNTV